MVDVETWLALVWFTEELANKATNAVEYEKKSQGEARTAMSGMEWDQNGKHEQPFEKHRV